MTFKRPSNIAVQAETQLYDLSAFGSFLLGATRRRVMTVELPRWQSTLGARPEEHGCYYSP